MEINPSKDSIVTQRTAAIETPSEYLDNLHPVEANIPHADDEHRRADSISAAGAPMDRVTQTVTRQSADGGTTYSPPEEDLAASRIKGALDAAVYDWRLFARLAREARLADLPARLQLTWAEFCKDRLRHPPDVVEALIAGVEVLGEEIPLPADVATRVGQFVLNTHGGDRKTADATRNQVDRVNLKGGNQSAYLLARLDRDHPVLAARVRAGELKKKMAARQAGILHDKTALEHLRHWWPKASARERTAFIDDIQSVRRPIHPAVEVSTAHLIDAIDRVLNDRVAAAYAAGDDRTVNTLLTRKQEFKRTIANLSPTERDILADQVLRELQAEIVR